MASEEPVEVENNGQQQQQEEERGAFTRLTDMFALRRRRPANRLGTSKDDLSVPVEDPILMVKATDYFHNLYLKLVGILHVLMVVLRKCRAWLVNSLNAIQQLVLFVVLRLPFLPVFLVIFLLHNVCFVGSAVVRLVQLVANVPFMLLPFFAGLQEVVNGQIDKACHLVDLPTRLTQLTLEKGELYVFPTFLRAMFTTNTLLNLVLTNTEEMDEEQMNAKRELGPKSKPNLMTLLWNPLVDLCFLAVRLIKIYFAFDSIVENGVVLKKLIRDADKEQKLHEDRDEVVRKFKFAKKYHNYALDIYKASEMYLRDDAFQYMRANKDQKRVIDTNIYELFPVIDALVKQIRQYMSDTWNQVYEAACSLNFGNIFLALKEYWIDVSELFRAGQYSWTRMARDFVLFWRTTVCPKYMIIEDMEQDVKTIVLVVRGTTTVADYLIDADAELEAFYNGYTHSGIARGAKILVDEVGSFIYERLESLTNAGIDCQLVVTGHSLGAGTAVLVDMIFEKERLFNGLGIRPICVALAPPPVFTRKQVGGGRLPHVVPLSQDPVERDMDIRIYVNKHDIVPRMSITTGLKLKYQMQDVRGILKSHRGTYEQVRELLTSVLTYRRLPEEHEQMLKVSTGAADQGESERLFSLRPVVGAVRGEAEKPGDEVDVRRTFVDKVRNIVGSRDEADGKEASLGEDDLYTFVEFWRDTFVGVFLPTTLRYLGNLFDQSLNMDQVIRVVLPGFMDQRLSLEQVVQLLTWSPKDEVRPVVEELKKVDLTGEFKNYPDLEHPGLVYHFTEEGGYDLHLIHSDQLCHNLDLGSTEVLFDHVQPSYRRAFREFKV